MPINVVMPALSPTMTEATLARWTVREGDAIRPGDVIAEIETDKATIEVEAVDAGVLSRIVAPEGARGVKVNSVIAVLLAAGEDAAAAAPSQDAAPSPATPAPGSAGPNGAQPPGAAGGRVFASPLARRIAAERGVALSAVRGSGPGGRIVRADVEGLEPAAAADPGAAPAGTLAAPAAETARGQHAGRPFEEAAPDGMRRAIAARMVEAQQTIPHVHLRREIELDALLALRAQLNDRGAGRGIRLSVNDFIVKACALALQAAPGCNVAWAGDRVQRFSASDVAVATPADGGLRTPVIRDAEAKPLAAISAEMRDLAERARAGRLAPHDCEGGALTVWNLGMFGIDSFDAVINPPQASILAVGAGVRRPVVRGEALAAATVMSVTLSVDHRAIDGALAAAFLAALKDQLEDPLSMLV